MRRTGRPARAAPNWRGAARAVACGLLLLATAQPRSGVRAVARDGTRRQGQRGRGSGGDDGDARFGTAADAAAGSSGDADAESRTFQHFVAHPGNMTCSADAHARPFNNQIRGVNLGGWMVLEPWITPSLFLQFLGAGVNGTAFDMHTFCAVLGAREANAQLRRHWDTWLTEDIIRQLSASGAVNSLRLPVGDFMYVPYGPYADGCVDGALDRVDLLLDWAYSHGLSVLLDIHTMKDSQNGFDNSGQSMGFAWTSALSSEFAGLTTFEHWPVRTAAWMGEFDVKTATYASINRDNLRHGLRVIEAVVRRYAGHPAVLGLEPVNEPWQYTPIETLKRFYWDGYLIVKEHAPYWKYVMHDSFRFDTNIWGGFMAGCPERALDTHIYQAWKDPDSRIGFYTDACREKRAIANMEREFGPVVVGEWSLATDNCAMWLNGFNDNLPGFPRSPCKYSQCTDPYMGTDQPGTPVDPTKPLQGPYGTGLSGPIFGLCPGSRDWIKEKSGNPYQGRDWITAPPEVPDHLDDTDNVMRHLAVKKINAFSGIGHGFFFWNFRTDLYEPQWSYMAALDRGWIPKGDLNGPEVSEACVREDNGAYRCVVKKGMPDQQILTAVSYILNVKNTTDTPDGQALLHKSGPDLYDGANDLIDAFFQQNRLNGVTCDFGGLTMLLEENVTLADDDTTGFSDDEYFTTTYIKTGPPVWLLLVGGLLTAAVSALLGFVVAMRTNRSFNQRVQSNTLFRPLAQSSNKLIRSSLALDDLGYQEIGRETSVPTF